MLALMMPKHSAVPPLTASASPGFVIGQKGIPGTGSVSTNPTSVSVSGGVGPYSYAWEYVSGATFTVNSPSSSTTSFSRVVGDGDEFNGVYRCKVTDSLSNVVYANNVSITIFGYQP